LLLVEDDRPTYTALRSLFTRRGWDVTIAITVSQAIAALSCPADARPDAVILDLMLPDGHGEEVLRHIRALRLPTRVVITTGLHDEQRLAQLQSLHPAAILQKPIDLAHLHQVLAEQN
jgi:DNA-binding response OmpR family regulator